MKEETIIKRSVSRKNNKIRRKYPLFADQFQTDYDTEKRKREDAKIDAEIESEWRKERSKLLWWKIEYYKRILITIGDEKFILAMYIFNKKYHRNQTCYLADALRKRISEKLNINPPCKVNVSLLNERFPEVPIPYGL